MVYCSKWGGIVYRYFVSLKPYAFLTLLPLAFVLTRAVTTKVRLVKLLKYPRLQLLFARPFIFVVHQVLPSQVYSLRPFPQFCTGKEQHRHGNDDSPFTVDVVVQEHAVVQNWDIDRRDDADESDDDRPEQELVAPKPECPCLRVGEGTIQKGASCVNKLPAEEEENPHHA